jgi:hypothetical protein
LIKILVKSKMNLNLEENKVEVFFKKYLKMNEVLHKILERRNFKNIINNLY